MRIAEGRYTGRVAEDNRNQGFRVLSPRELRPLVGAQERQAPRLRGPGVPGRGRERSLPDRQGSPRAQLPGQEAFSSSAPDGYTNHQKP